MAHYAFLDENNIVTEVIVGRDEDELDTDWEVWYSEFRKQRCLRTSYNTDAGVHKTGGIPFRKNYAGVGYTYSDELDAFIPPKPYDSWILNLDSCQWDPPVPRPADGNWIAWDEEAQSWIPNDPGLML